MITLKSTSAALLATAALMSVPASANEARVESRGGVAWVGGDEEAVAGLAVGYDFDLSDAIFVGVEGSADKLLIEGTDIVFGATGRLGTEMSGVTKLFVAGGVSVSDGEEDFHLGAGLEQTVSDDVYFKLEYRRFFNEFKDANTIVAGVGLRI